MDSDTLTLLDMASVKVFSQSERMEPEDQSVSRKEVHWVTLSPQTMSGWMLNMDISVNNLCNFLNADKCCVFNISVSVWKVLQFNDWMQ